MASPSIRFTITLLSFAAIGLSGCKHGRHKDHLVKAQTHGLDWPAVVLIGMVTAVGGGVTRDVLCREEPLLFRPGQFYALAALSGCFAFVGLTGAGLLTQGSAGFLCAGIILLVRMGSVRFGWRTHRLTKEHPTSSGDPTS